MSRIKITNRKILRTPQVAHVQYQEVKRRGDVYLPCTARHTDEELIKEATLIHNITDTENLEFTVKRV